MSDASHGYHPGHSSRLQLDDEDKHSVRGAQLLLAGAILQQYCTAGEEEGDESEDGSNVIDVRHSTSLGLVFCSYFFIFETDDRKRGYTVIPRRDFQKG